MAVDAPSGLDGATGQVAEPTVRADMTITFGLPKLGQMIFPGKEYCGQLLTADIGFPERAINEEQIKINLLMENEAAEMLPFRAPDGNKGDFGKLFVLAGSTGYTGAAALTAESGLRCRDRAGDFGMPQRSQRYFRDETDRGNYTPPAGGA